MLKQIAKGVALIALFAFPILLWVWQSQGFPIDVNACQHYAANGECENYAPEHIYLFLPRKIGELLRDSAFVTALATIAIAWFTWTLRRSTEKMWVETRKAANAAKDSADAAVATERARFYVIIRHNFIACIDDAQHFTGTAEQEEAPLSAGSIPYANISFKNYGRTPGIVFEIGSGIVFSEKVPEPVFEVKAIGENMIAAGDTTDGFGEVISDQMTIRKAKELISGRANIWIYGYMNYEDVFGKTHTHRFFQRLISVGSYRYILQPYDYKHYNQST